MLYQLGDVQFEVAPLNVNEADRATGHEFAGKAVLGRRPPLEAVGASPEDRSFRGSLFPHRLGGLVEFAALEAIQAAGQPVHLMRGDGVPQGWFVIFTIRETYQHLDAKGVPQQIDFEIQLGRADPPAGDRQRVAVGQLSATLEGG